MKKNEHHVLDWRLNRLIETYGGNSKELRSALLELKQRRAEERFNETRISDNDSRIPNLTTVDTHDEPMG